jgi:hypothetical protein
MIKAGAQNRLRTAIRDLSDGRRPPSRTRIWGKQRRFVDRGHRHLTAKVIKAKVIPANSLRDGAFAPLSSQPLVKALLLPLVSYGATILVRTYALPGALEGSPSMRSLLS